MGGYEPPAQMGILSERTADHRSPHVLPHVRTRTPCSATLDAKRPETPENTSPVPTKKERPKFRPAPDDFSEFTNRSAVILPSRPDAPPSSVSNTADLWSPVLYDPNSDSVRIIPPSRPSPLASQFRDFKDKINVKTHRLAGLLSPERSETLPLPLRAHEADHKASASTSNIQISSQSSSHRLGRANWKEFDLMAPPSGRRRSCKTTQDDSCRPEPKESEDANPSEALTSQIASAIRQERQRARASDAAPLKLQPNERPQGHALKHRGQKSESSIAASKLSPKRLAPKSRSVPPGRRQAEDDDDPFPYDKPSHHGFTGRASPSPEISATKIRSEVNMSEFPCPYRRRNPVLFNVRDHEHCARRPFQDLGELKQHIRAYHRRLKTANHCPRCKKSFSSDTALSDHLTVPIEDMCQPRLAMADHLVEDGITEETEKALFDETTKIQSWKELWWLLFPQDPAVLDPEIIPVVEVIEAEQEFDDSSAELKADLCESLKRILPDQTGDGALFHVLAGQIQLVLEQHRAKILRKCRNNAKNGEKWGSMDRKMTRTSRFSVATTSYGSQGCGRRPSLHSDRTRKSQWQSFPTRTSISPASSVYSQASGSHYSLASNYQPATRTSSFSSAGALHVESPRLPFRDWVHGVKSTNEGISPSQRDSGLALQCDECNSEPCQCGSYADQLSAFLLTPAVKDGSDSLTSHEAMSRAVEEDDVDWAAHYGGQVLSAGGLMAASGLHGNSGKDRLRHDIRGQGMLSGRSHVAQKPSVDFI
ncbi:hypothetical protein N0V93_002979 [Gnomoniopsis smithogilvyi]|uniref:C2H2-type domain-containing protein n=1 Tax=Gnomoniopsis smithogilvyi TaxID=1191159 RepID=A0A9W9CZP4_9PEZI|nr:hypothetical protein N0V93_002979 [Gnomoniopsis smithogilvyi]